MHGNNNVNYLVSAVHIKIARILPGTKLYACPLLLWSLYKPLIMHIVARQKYVSVAVIMMVRPFSIEQNTGMKLKHIADQVQNYVSHGNTFKHLI